LLDKVNKIAVFWKKCKISRLRFVEEKSFTLLFVMKFSQTMLAFKQIVTIKSLVSIMPTGKVVNGTLTFSSFI